MLLRRSLLIFTLICAHLTGFADKPDSFHIGINTTGMKDSIDFYLLESEQLIESNPIQSSANAQKAIDLSSKFKFQERYAYASRLLGEAKLSIKDYYNAEKHLISALKYYENKRNEGLLADIHFFLGLSQYYLSKYTDALQNFQKASLSFKKTGENQKYANTLQSIGLAYNNLGELDKSEDYYFKSLALNNELENNKNIAELYQNLGIVCYKKRDYSQAINYYEKSISFFKKDHDLEGLGVTYSNMGLVNLKKKEYKNAVTYFERANTYFYKSDYLTGQMWAHNNIGAAYASLFSFTEAEVHFKKSLEIAEKSESLEGKLTNYQDLSKFYEQTGKYSSSLNFNKKYSKLKDSVNNSVYEDKLSELETLYHLENKEKKMYQAELGKKKVTTQVWLLISILSILIFASIIILSAILQKRKAEKKLSQNKLSLQQLVEKRTVELQQQISGRKNAEESDKLKSAFLANMSHELRTPMNAIIAFSNFLREPDLSEMQKEEYLDHISTAGDSLLSLIDDIIDIAKIESQQLKIFIQPTNINRVLVELYKVFSELRTKNNKNHIRFKLNTDDDYNYIINTDSNRLKQVLSNLLENAFKYTEKGKVEMGFETTENSVTFFVSDTGPGIPKDKHELIFDRFYQLRYLNEKRTTHGTGLGLAICKNLVKLLGGKIWVDSEEGKGSKFMIRVPVESIKKQVNSKIKGTKKETSIITNKYNWNNITILVAEDEDLNYKVLDTCLSRTKAHIIRARDGASAVEICKTQKVDLVLMDIQMPGMNGYEATKEIKRLNNRTPVIAQTSFAMLGEKERCLQAGCDDFITKPLNIDKLFDKIKNHILMRVK